MQLELEGRERVGRSVWDSDSKPKRPTLRREQTYLFPPDCKAVRWTVVHSARRASARVALQRRWRWAAQPLPRRARARRRPRVPLRAAAGHARGLSPEDDSILSARWHRRMHTQSVPRGIHGKRSS